MSRTRDLSLPADMVSVGVLLATTFMPLPMEGIAVALRHLGGPCWQPVEEVVATAVERLLDQGWLEASATEDGETRLAPSPAARERLPILIEALPLSPSSPDLPYRLKVMALDLLEDPGRARLLRLLLDHWEGRLRFWQDAQLRCPCGERSVRRLMQRNLALARSEIDWLAAVQGHFEPAAGGEAGR